MYLFNYLDRNAIVNAKLNNLDSDLGLQGTQYNTLVSILFVGYVFLYGRAINSEQRSDKDTATSPDKCRPT